MIFQLQKRSRFECSILNDIEQLSRSQILPERQPKILQKTFGCLIFMIFAMLCSNSVGAPFKIVLFCKRDCMSVLKRSLSNVFYQHLQFVQLLESGGLSLQLSVCYRSCPFFSKRTITEYDFEQRRNSPQAVT